MFIVTFEDGSTAYYTAVSADTFSYADDNGNIGIIDITDNQNLIEYVGDGEWQPVTKGL